MRKVTLDIMQAWLCGDKLTKSNNYTDGKTVYLHGNAIVKRENGYVYISAAGVQSNTTKERLNGLLELLNIGKYVYQSKWVWYLGDDKFSDLEDKNGWIKIK